MITSRRGLILIAVVTLVASLLATFPARVAYNWASPSQLAASGIHGSVWRGGADAAETNGVVMLDVRWRFRPLQLFVGRVSFRVDAKPASGFFESNVGIGLGGTIFLSDLSAALPLSTFAERFNMRGLGGDTSLRFERIELRDNRPVAAVGVVDANNVVSSVLGTGSIGAYRAEFFTQDDAISAAIEDTDAVIDLAGSLEIESDGSYRLIGQVAEKPNTPAALRKQLQFLGAANQRGQREFRVEGSL